MTRVQLQVIQFLNMCHTLINYIVVAWRVAHKVQLHLNWHIWMNMYINTIYTCCMQLNFHLQLVLGNYTNLQLHVSHVTKF
jgi:hypothetical protein